MGDRNHLHVCRHCGNVMATASPTGPRRCNDCGESLFSTFMVVPELTAEPDAGIALNWRLYGQFSKETGVKETIVPVQQLGDLRPTVRDALKALVDEYEPLRALVLTEDGSLRGNGAILHNHTKVYNDPADLDAEIRPNDTLALLPRIY